MISNRTRKSSSNQRRSRLKLYPAAARMALLPCSALACSTNCPPLSAVAGVAIDTLQLNSYGARALPRPMHSTSGACNE